MQLLMKNYFEIFGFPIYFYALTMVGGMLSGAFIAWLLMKRRGLKADIILDMMVVILPLAIIGARVYYVIFEWESYNSFLEMINIRSGGLAIYGGVIGGALGVLVICLWKKMNFLKLADVLVPALILGQAIGRWGNFFNQEAHGELVTNPKFYGLPWSVNIDGSYYQATFFYESMWCLLGFALLFVFAWRYRDKANGLITMAYFVWYGLERVVVEGMRTDSLYIGSTNIRVSQLLSALLVLGGLVGAFVILYLRRKKGKQAENACVSENTASMAKQEGAITSDSEGDGSAKS